VLYVSGEESAAQIMMRAERLGVQNSHIELLTEQDIDIVKDTIISKKPTLAVIDSIQTVYSNDVEGSQGNINQVKECTRILTEVAKSMKFPLCLLVM